MYPEIPQASPGCGYEWEHFNRNDPNFTCLKMCMQNFKYFRNFPNVLISTSITARC